MNVERTPIYFVPFKDPQTTVKMKLTGILAGQNAIRHEWFGFDNVVEYIN